MKQMPHLARLLCLVLRCFFRRGRRLRCLRHPFRRRILRCLNRGCGRYCAQDRAPCAARRRYSSSSSGRIFFSADCTSHACFSLFAARRSRGVPCGAPLFRLGLGSCHVVVWVKGEAMEMAMSQERVQVSGNSAHA